MKTYISIYTSLHKTLFPAFWGEASGMFCFNDFEVLVCQLSVYFVYFPVGLSVEAQKSRTNNTKVVGLFPGWILGRQSI